MKNSRFKALQILHTAFLAGQILFAAVALFLVQTGSMGTTLKNIENILLPIVVILALIGFIAGGRLFKARLQKLNDTQPAGPSFFSDYTSACITRWALLEGPCLFAIISFMLTGNYLFYVVIAALLIIFISTRPTKTNVSSQTGMTTDELDAIS